MLKLIIPRTLLEFIDNNREGYSRPTYILKCVNYIMINNITINNEGVEFNERTKELNSRREGDDHDRV